MADVQPVVDLYVPAEITRRMEQTGVTKANLPLYKSALLAVLAGAFIALGSVFFLTATTDVKGGFGVGQVLGGLSFCLGLALVVIAGAELFTGNCLAIIAAASGKISVGKLLRNWLVVWLGNLVGALLIAGIVYGAQHCSADANLVGARALSVGASKAALPFWVAFWRGIMCNLLVCLAVWLAAAGRTVTDKMLGVLLPVSAFVAAGFEHSVANMFFIPYALFIKAQPAVVSAAALAPDKLAHLTWGGFVMNLIPVTLGNIVGGAVFVGLAYWLIYLWDSAAASRKVA